VVGCGVKFGDQLQAANSVVAHHASEKRTSLDSIGAIANDIK